MVTPHGINMPKAIPPLHAAIWDGDLGRIQELLGETTERGGLRELLEVRDVHGHSALHLALRVVQPSQKAIVRLLLRHGASVSSRNLLGWSCLHDAALLDDEALLAHVFLQGERQLWRQLTEHQDEYLEAIERIPDFEVEIFVEAYSWIPGLSKLLPSQTNRIFKRRSQLRIDLSMTGLERFNLNHGNISYIFTGRGQQTHGGFILNHDTKTFYDLAGAVNSSPPLTKVELGMHMLVTKEQTASEVQAHNLEFKKIKDVKVIKTKRRSDVSAHARAWSGAKYAMRNFAVRVDIRPATNPGRKPRHFAEAGVQATQAAIETLHNYMDELAVNSDTREKAARRPASTSTDTTAAVDGTQELHIPKGETREMHLDVLSNDLIMWNFTSTSREFSFSATAYHDDAVLVVCQSKGIKGTAIVGQYQSEANGSFVLRWTNSQKGLTLDKKGVKIAFQIVHKRPTAVPLRSSTSPTTTDESVSISFDAPTSMENNACSLEAPDLELCQQFDEPNRIPNPLTTTLSLADYATGVIQSGPKEASVGLFKRKKKVDEGASLSQMSTFEADGETYRNTYRSITLPPMPRSMQKTFEASVYMAEDFPIQVRDFLPIIEILSQTSGDRQAEVLSEFFQLKLPPGFPVRFELPMMFTVRAAYTFQRAELRDDIDPALFELPPGYRQVFALKDILPEGSGLIIQNK